MRDTMRFLALGLMWLTCASSSPDLQLQVTAVRLCNIVTVPVTSQMNSLLQTEGRGEGRDTDIEVGTDTDMDECGQIMAHGCRGCGDGDGAFSCSKSLESLTDTA